MKQSSAQLFIYKLIARDFVGYDAYVGHVVVAESSKKARKMCPHGRENLVLREGAWQDPPDGKLFWTDPTKSKIIKIGIANLKKVQIIISSFCAG